LRTAGNQRRFDGQAVETINRINQMVNVEGYTLDGARRQLRNLDGRRETPQEDPKARLSALAETMSDYLLQKLFERVRAEEAERTKGLGVNQ
jgi:DNA-binding transcriptional MerR regulator